ncbi:hypothetical protein [Vibrio phage vB_VpaP_SJSY21]|nr:hypothetical protein [Vibrio phage vB_VpaP_SJSY21]
MINLQELPINNIYTLLWENQGVTWSRYVQRFPSGVKERYDGAEGDGWTTLSTDLESLIDGHNRFESSGERSRSWAEEPIETLRLAKGKLYTQEDLDLSNNRKCSEVFAEIENILSANLKSICDEVGLPFSGYEGEFNVLFDDEKDIIREILK